MSKTEVSGTKRRRPLMIAICVLLCIGVALVIAAFVLSHIVKASGEGRIFEVDAVPHEQVQVILVLGCGVREDGTPSHMLQDRLDTALSLYESGAAPKILVSGDHGSVDYDEANTMKNYLVERGVPSEDVFMDHAGFSTYESMYRADAIFGVERAIVVTQKYHLYRALYDARAFGIEAFGVPSDPRSYVGQLARELREVVARAKDYIWCILRPEPTYLGETIDVSANGNITNG